jgi:hypothetical protein
MFRNPDTRQALSDPENYKRMFINPLDNAKNLSQEYLDSLQNAPESYRRRFFLGQYTAETDGALWSYERLDQIRVLKADLPMFARIVWEEPKSGHAVMTFLSRQLNAATLPQRPVRDTLICA